MTERAPSPIRGPRTENKTITSRKQKSSATTARCRRELQSSFNAVDNVKESSEKTRSKQREVNHHLVYPRCSTCTDRAPGRLRKFAVSVCSVCDVYLCTTCTRKHRSNSNGHIVVPISPKLDAEKHFLAKNGHQSALLCHEGHKDFPKYFCETCQDVVCLECIETQHKKHEFMYAKDAYGKHKVALEKYIENARAEAHGIVKQLQQGDEMMVDLKREKEGIDEKIKAQTELIIEVLRNREKKLLQDSERIYSRKEDVVNKNKERLHNRLELIRRTCRFTEIAMNDGNEIQVLIFEKYARKRLEDLCRAELRTPGTIGASPRYYVANDYTDKAAELLGKVVCSSVEPNQCEAHGEGLRRAIVGHDSCFMVSVKTKDGTPLTTGGDDVHAQVTSTRDEHSTRDENSTRDEHSLEVRVRDECNGTYSVTYSPKTNGVLTIGVRVYGEPIKTPQCKVHAVCQRDYDKIQKPSLIITRLILSGKELTLKLPCGVAVDSQGRILVADCHNHSIKIFTRDGKFLKSFGCYGSKNGQLNNPTDIAVNGDTVYVCDKDNSRIQCFTSEGVFLRKFSCGTSQLKRPWGICIDGKGHVLVADTKNNQIQIFTRDGQFVASFGREGSGESEFLQPYFVTAHSNGHIYISDNGNHRVQVFDESYSYLFQFGDDGHDIGLKYPTGITTDHQGHVIVADQCNSRLQVYQANGMHKAIISKPLATSHCPSYPKGLAVTQDGYIVVADSDNDKVILL